MVRLSEPANNFATDAIVFTADTLARNTQCPPEEKNDWLASPYSPLVTDLGEQTFDLNTLITSSYIPLVSSVAPNIDQVAARIFGDVKENNMPLDSSKNALIQAFVVPPNISYSPLIGNNMVDATGSYEIKGIPDKNVQIRIVPGDTNSNLLGEYPNGRRTHDDVVDVVLSGCSSTRVDFDAESTTLGIGDNNITGNIYAGLGNEPKFKEGDPLDKVLVHLLDPTSLVALETTTTDALGNFKFVTLPDGTYNVKADVPALPDSMHDNIQVGPFNRNQVGINFELVGDIKIEPVAGPSTPIDRPILQQTFKAYPNPSHGGPIRFSKELHEVRDLQPEWQNGCHLRKDAGMETRKTSRRNLCRTSQRRLCPPGD